VKKRKQMNIPRLRKKGTACREGPPSLGKNEKNIGFGGKMGGTRRTKRKGKAKRGEKRGPLPKKTYTPRKGDYYNANKKKILRQRQKKRGQGPRGKGGPRGEEGRTPRLGNTRAAKIHKGGEKKTACKWRKKKVKRECRPFVMNQESKKILGGGRKKDGGN